MIVIIPGNFQFNTSDIINFSTLKDHVIDVKVDIENSEKSVLSHWTVVCELFAEELILNKKIFSKYSMKCAKNNICFKFLCNFTVVAEHKITLKLKLVNPLNSVIDEKITTQIIKVS